MTPDELSDLHELHEQASPAPWVTNTWIDDDGDYQAQIEAANGHIVLSQYATEVLPIQNHQMIREARNTLPALLDHIDKLTKRAERAEQRLARINREHPEIYEQALTASTAAQAEAWEEGFTQGAAYYHESGKEPADFTETATTLNPYKDQARKDNS